MLLGSQPNKSETLILVKALPHVGQKSGETVCCAGVDKDGNWARLFPVHFRMLEGDQKFKRWDWVEYEWYKPKNDQRSESRRIQENSLTISSRMKDNEKHLFLERLIRLSTDHASSLGETLTLIKPKNISLKITKRTADEMTKLSEAYEKAIKQLSMFDNVPKQPMAPCPHKFTYQYENEDGQIRNSTSDDWEMSTTFFNWEKLYGEKETLKKMLKVYGEDLPTKGVLFALGTHSLWPDQWLLVGVIKYNEPQQIQMAL